MQEKKIEAKELIEQIIEGIQDKKGKGIVVKGALSGELGKWKISAEDGQRNVEFLKKELYIVPNFTDFKVEQDQEEPIRPYRIRMSSTADRDIFLGTKIGFVGYGPYTHRRQQHHCCC